jgi:DNA-binding response OmpR family regulator
MTTSKRILLVEDNEDLALLLQEILEERGHTVCMALDGMTALDIAHTFDAELAILDLGIPGINGLDLARKLAVLHPDRKAPHLFALTGFDDPNDRQLAKQAGFEKFFVKPLLPDVLEHAVDELGNENADADERVSKPKQE